MLWLWTDLSWSWNWTWLDHELVMTGSWHESVMKRSSSDHGIVRNWSWIIFGSWDGHELILTSSGTDHEHMAHLLFYFSWIEWWIDHGLIMTFSENDHELIMIDHKLIMNLCTYVPSTLCFFFQTVFVSKHFWPYSRFTLAAAAQFPENSTTKTHHDLDIS